MVVLIKIDAIYIDEMVESELIDIDDDEVDGEEAICENEKIDEEMPFLELPHTLMLKIIDDDEVEFVQLVIDELDVNE